MNKLYIRIILFACIGLSAFIQNEPNWDNMDNILQKIKAPEFQNKTFVITEFGAIGDGITDCTKSIADAIDSCSKNGGGKVVIPKGIFLTGAIHLKSNLNLNIEEGATLLFSKDYTKYLPVVLTRFEGTELMNYSPFIYAINQENIAITGKGTIDGNADINTWWPWTGSAKDGWKTGMPNHKEDKINLNEMSENNVPVEKRIFGPGHYLRTNFIQLYNCKNILIEDIKIIRSPMWEINPVLSSNIIVRNVNINSHGANNDGCDPESCSDVLIENCFFNTGDDCIAIKSGREQDGRRINVPSENIIVRNCEMKDGHGGVVIGSEISGNCRNVYIENCKMNSPNLDRALRIKSNPLRGGIVENVYMRNVTVGEVSQAVILVDLYYENINEGKFPPTVRNIYVDNVTSEKSPYAVWLKGYEDAPVSNVQISNCNFNGVMKGNMNFYTKNVVFKNVYINDKLTTWK
jgi:polygalacturonase